MGWDDQEGAQNQNLLLSMSPGVAARLFFVFVRAARQPCCRTARFRDIDLVTIGSSQVRVRFSCGRICLIAWGSGAFRRIEI